MIPVMKIFHCFYLKMIDKLPVHRSREAEAKYTAMEKSWQKFRNAREGISRP